MTNCCPNCGSRVKESEAACAECGFADFHTWPPPPAGWEDSAVAPGESREPPARTAAYRGISDFWTIAKQPRQDFLSGLVAGGLTQFFLWCLAAFSPFGLYFSQFWEKPLVFDVFAFSLPMLVVTFVCFAMRRRDLAFARGLGYSVLITFGFFLCSVAVWH